MKTIFCDCDGVLSNFIGEAAAAWGRQGYVAPRWNFFEDWGLTEEQFWARIDGQGEDFWTFMQPMSDYQEIYQMCSYFADEVVILTSPPRAHWAWSGRVKWIQRMFGGPAFRDFSLTPSGLKHLFAAPGRLLLDDSTPNVDQFKAAGGDSLLWPQPWNENRGVIGSRLTWLERNLGIWRRT